MVEKLLLNDVLCSLKLKVVLNTKLQCFSVSFERKIIIFIYLFTTQMKYISYAEGMSGLFRCNMQVTFISLPCYNKFVLIIH